MMEDLLRVLFLLCALAAPGTTLQCAVCISESSLKCDGELQQCPANHLCASAYQIILSAGGAKQFGVARSCVPQNKCDVSGSMSLTGGNLFMGTSCCNEDGCEPHLEPPNIQPNAQPNGVKCNICTSDNSCQNMECRGDENQCVNYVMKVSSGSQPSVTSVRGCGVENLCRIKSYSYTIGNVKVEHDFTCTGGRYPSNGGISITGPSNGVIIVSLLLTVAVILNIQLIKEH